MRESDRLEYRCRNCREFISPDVDSLKNGWGTCPHCDDSHPTVVKRWIIAAAAFFLLTVMLVITIVGVVLAPFTLVVAVYCYSRASRELDESGQYIGEYVHGK